MTLRAIAERIQPIYAQGAPTGAPDKTQLARALAVYSQNYLPVPVMDRFQVGLRIPLPIEIDPQSQQWIVNPPQIELWSRSYDPAWDQAKVLDRQPNALTVASAKDQAAAVDDFLAQNQTPLAQGIGLASRLLTNAFAFEQFALAVFDRLGDKGFDVALAFMDETVRHQAELLAAQGGGTAVHWRLRTILSLPPAKLDAGREVQRQRALAMLPTHTELGRTAGDRPVEAYFIQGTSSERALIIAGVHGSERSGVEVVKMLREELEKPGMKPYYTTLIVPALFPDNVAKGQREGATETNRDFPAKGSSLDTAIKKGKDGVPVDALGKPILAENVMLLRLIERWRPSRTASVHATWDRSKGGVFTDPRMVSAGASGAAKQDDAATAADRKLAFDMALEAQKRGGRVGGNRLDKGLKGFVDDFPAPKPVGVSFGGYGPQDVNEGKATDRPSMTVITMEVAGNDESDKTPDKQRAARITELKALRDVLLFLFLEVPGPRPGAQPKP